MKQQLLERFKASWTPWFEIAVWLVGMAVMFTPEPSRLQVESNQELFTYLAQFVTTVFLIISFIYLNTEPRLLWRPAKFGVLAFVMLIAAIVALIAYLLKLNEWSCGYDGRGPMIIGETYTPAAEASVLENPPQSCTRLVQEYAGQTEMIWDRGEISFRWVVLGFGFAAVTTLFALAAFLAIHGFERLSGGKSS